MVPMDRPSRADPHRRDVLPAIHQCQVEAQVCTSCSNLLTSNDRMHPDRFVVNNGDSSAWAQKSAQWYNVPCTAYFLRLLRTVVTKVTLGAEKKCCSRGNRRDH